MKKASKSKSRRPQPAGIQAEYRFDYAKAHPNRFAAKMKENTVAVIVDPDVAAVFQTSEAVNSVLRSVLSALPEDLKRKPTAG
jgi:hypothetical protein